MSGMTQQPLTAPHRILVIVGSSNDLPVMQAGIEILESLEFDVDVRVASAHRAPDVVRELATGARSSGYRAIIAAAGMAAHLPGVVASFTTLPVIGVPIDAGPLRGQDALLSISQMPKGIPVATVAINGAVNAGLLAAEIVAVFDHGVEMALVRHRQRMREEATPLGAFEIEAT